MRRFPLRCVLSALLSLAIVAGAPGSEAYQAFAQSSAGRAAESGASARAIPTLGLPGLSSPVPSFSALRLSAPAIPDFPLAPSLMGTRVLGIPGPGVTPAHIEAAKVLAERTREAVVIHGSRQTGFSHHTGLPFAPDADLNTGVIGSPAKIPWDGESQRVNVIAVPSIEDAVGRGYLVVAPTPRRLPRDLEALRYQARRRRTDAQLTGLAVSPRSSEETFRFVVIGDAEPGRFWLSRILFNKPGVFWKLLARADRSGSDFIVQLGDMVSRGTVSHFRAFISGLFSVGLKTPYLTAIGNHDRHKPHGITNDRVYRAVFGSPDYAFDRGGRRFIVLDSSAGRVTPVQLSWLTGLLSPDIPTVVFTHMPPAPLSEWTDWGVLKGAGGFMEGSEAFMSLMSANKVQRVYMGHIHGLGVLERGGVKYVLTGGGGSPLFPWPVKHRFHHWLSVEAGPEGLVETVHAADGSSFPLR